MKCLMCDEALTANHIHIELCSDESPPHGFQVCGSCAIPILAFVLQQTTGSLTKGMATERGMINDVHLQNRRNPYLN